MEYTTINVKHKTFENLKRRAVYGQTMDGLITWFLDKIPEDYLEPHCSDCSGLLTSKVGTKLQSCTICGIDFKVKKVRNDES
jgi:PHP family Zn ribbon phosphoesterase